MFNIWLKNWQKVRITECREENNMWTYHHSYERQQIAIPHK